MWSAIAVIATVTATGCASPPKTALEQMSQANALSADLLVQFTKAGDAANRSVMADTDESSVAFAQEAQQATQAVQKDTDALRQTLVALQFTDEGRLLDEFGKRFGEYRALDQNILGLAVENTNLKAQRVSFGPGQEAADAFRTALKAIAPASPENASRVEALAATAVADVREIQVLQAPHIAESNDAVMTRIEKQMTTSEEDARTALETLGTLVRPASRPPLAAATAALNRFMELDGQVIALSRRNTNVRSLALSLGQKRMLTAACEDSLRALQEALAKRGFSATR